MITECDGCRLCRTAKTFVFASGDPDARVVIVGEGPGPDEDRAGAPWVGRAGKTLTRLLEGAGFARDDVYLTNVVKCFPNDGGAIRKPAADEVAACTARWTFPELEGRRATMRVLVPVGAVAASAVFGARVSITDVRGIPLPSRFCDLTVPVLHPSYLNRQRDARLDGLTRGDFALIRRLADGEPAEARAIAGGSAPAPAAVAVQAGQGGVSADMEQQIIEAALWHPDRKYIAGWSEDEKVTLMYRDAAGRRQRETVDHPWYFYMRTDDALKVPTDVWKAWQRVGVFRRLEIDERHPEWTRVYALRKVTQTQWLRDRGEVGVGINILDDPRTRTDKAVAGTLRRDDERRAAMDAARVEMLRSGVYRQIDEGYQGFGSIVGTRTDTGRMTAGASMVADARRRMIETGKYERVDEGFQVTASRSTGGKRGFSKEAATRTREMSANWKKYEDEVKLHDFLEMLHDPSAGGPTFEADLTPRQRFMTDRLVTVEDRYNELYFDLETDDSVPGWEGKETWRHLSVAAIFVGSDGRVERHSFRIGRESDAAERAMLREFHEACVDRADVVYAWNGFNFDFPILRARFRKYGIQKDWREVIWCDLLAVWRRYHFRGASAITSFALGELGPKMLHREKLDWRAESARRGRRVDRIIDLYRHHPDLLQEYNEVDADLLYSLEREYGYAHVERVFCRIGNCFVNDYHVSTKVDMLLLNKGSTRGEHFYTRGLQMRFLPAYIKEMQKVTVRKLGAEGEVETVATAAVARERRGEGGGRASRGESAKWGAGGAGNRAGAEYTGAYVFPPVVGYHEGVAALDFKSLYPTVMTLFNVSPESWVSRDDAPKHAPERLTRTPSGAFFRKDPTGMIPLVFRETMEKRKVYTRLQLAEEIGSEKFLLYYRLAYAYKRLGLSFYGELGNETSRYFNPEVAEAVTLGGQWFIKKTAELAERRGYRVLAGDTDSLYLKMTEAQAEVFVKECDAYYREIVKPFNVDMSRFLMELEYENYFDNVIFVKKKRYAGRMTVFKGKASDVIEVKGLECMRSDGVEYARVLQRKALDLVLRGRLPEPGAVAALIEAARDEVLSGSLGVDQIITTQAIEKPIDEYKSKPPHVRVAERIRATSTEYFVGMKVPFVMVPGETEKGQPTAVPVWAREYAEGSYDAPFLWNKRVWPPTQRVLEAAYPAEDWLRFFAPTESRASRGKGAPKPEKPPKLPKPKAEKKKRERR